MDIRSQVRLHHDSGVAELDVTNTFHWQTSITEAASITAIRANLENFYSTTNEGFLGPLSEYFSSELSGVVGVTMYDLADPTPRVPIDEYEFTTAVPSGEPLPSQVALCLSFQGARISGTPQARRRGRVYLGPLDITATEVSGGEARPVSGLIDVALAAAERMLADSTTNNSHWAVYSPTNNDLVPVVGGWLDNRFDIQRRRAALVTQRNAWGS